MSIYVPPRPSVKAMLGPGAVGMEMQRPLQSFYGPLSQQKLMYQAATFWKTDPWIRAAERVISGKFSTVEWHLEDADDTEIDDLYTDQRYQDVRTLIERPQATVTIGRQMTRRELWSITSRHMGACGNAFWYLDQLEPTGKTPGAILYIAPWRMSASTDAHGNLTGWVLDWNEDSGTGTPLETYEVLQFTLEPPDEGQFGIGLVESAMSFATLDRLTIGHAGTVLSSGGRLAGVISPKTESIPDEKFQQLVRDFRTISELPDNAKRVNILQSPVQFDRTAATPLELSLLDLMNVVRDDILSLWGVPLSQIGGATAGGLNSGDKTKWEEAALWQNGVHPRLVSFGETLQFQLLDRWKVHGMVVEMELEEPEFDDDGPRFDLLSKSVNLPMRNEERRALIGLDPFGDPLLDQAVWLPLTLVQVATAPDPNAPTVNVLPASPTLALGTGSVDEAKARITNPLHASLVGLRKRVERRETPPLKDALRTFLDSQRREIVSRLRTTDAGRVKGDPYAILPKRWDAELHKVLARHLSTMAVSVNEHISGALPAKAGPVGAVERAMTRGAARVTKINDTTRTKIQEAVARGITDGLSVLEVADLIETSGEVGGLSMGSLFDEYRAELIARTELMDAYNGAALGSYSDGGITQVEAIDGDGDEECAARDGQTFDVEEADTIEDHPNGTLDWVPVIPEVSEGKALLKAVLDLATRVQPTPVVNVYPPDITVNTPDVTVTSPDIHFTPPDISVTTPDVKVVVNIPEPKSTSKRVERDHDGRIVAVHEE